MGTAERNVVVGASKQERVTWFLRANVAVCAGDIKRANPDVFYMSLQNSATGSLMAIQAKRFRLKAKILSQDAVPAESVTAMVNPAKCTGCGVCVEVCAYNAVSLDDNGISVINTSMCKGCGACVAGCRSDAVTLKNIGNEHVMAAVDAAFENW